MATYTLTDTIRDTGQALTAATHYFGVAAPDALAGFQVLGDGTIVATVTYESTFFTQAALDNTSGEWKDEADVTDISVTAVAGSGDLRHIGNLAAPRGRIKVVVSTPGTLRVAATSKPSE